MPDMPLKQRFTPHLYLAAMLVMFITAVVFRPLMPIDETRYFSVAWEMWLRGQPFAPLTMNFEPYSHKPPMLFWIINLFWSAFGVSRWAGTLPLVLMACANLYLVDRIYRKLFPDHEQGRAGWMLFATVPFIAYSTVIMFDLSVCLFIQMAVLCLLNFANDRSLKWMFGLGLILGLGVLTKGPVAYLYILYPVLFGPLWMGKGITKKRWYLGFLLAFFLSLIPVLLWLVPVLELSNQAFAIKLIWQQTAERITGKMAQSHARPFYFYLEVLPAIFIPWAFFPQFWRGLKPLWAAAKTDRSFYFLALWFVPTFISFCLISGKQPHYMVPLMPPAIIAMTYMFQSVRRKTILMTAAGMLCLFVVGHAIGSRFFFPAYDMTQIATDLQPYKNGDIAYVSNYHAEVGFLGRMEKSVDDVQIGDLDNWFKTHPGGVAIIRHEDPSDVEKYETIGIYPFRSKATGIFKEKREP